MHALMMFTLPASNGDFVSAAPLIPMRVTLLMVCVLPPSSSRPTRRSSTSPSTAVPYLTTLGAGPSRAATLAPGRPMEQVTLRDVLRLDTLFD